MVKVGKASEAVRELTEEGEERATDALLSDYSATPATGPLRTARTPMAQTDRVLQVRPVEATHPGNGRNDIYLERLMRARPLSCLFVVGRQWLHTYFSVCGIFFYTKCVLCHFLPSSRLTIQ